MQHIAATAPSLEILKLLLLRGASVHMRNKAGRTALFLAAKAGLSEHVSLLRQSGAHLHADEMADARLNSQRQPTTWQAAGVYCESMSMQVLARPDELETRRPG